MATLARIGRGFGATILLTISGALVFGGYSECGGLHGWNEGQRRMAERGLFQFGTVLVIGGVLVTLGAIAILGKRWDFRWCALGAPIGLFLVGFGKLENDGRLISSVGAFIAIVSLGLALFGPALFPPQRGSPNHIEKGK